MYMCEKWERNVEARGRWFQEDNSNYLHFSAVPCFHNASATTLNNSIAEFIEYLLTNRPHIKILFLWLPIAYSVPLISFTMVIVNNVIACRTLGRHRCSGKLVFTNNYVKLLDRFADLEFGSWGWTRIAHKLPAINFHSSVQHRKKKGFYIF